MARERRIIDIGGPGLGDSMSYRELPELLTAQGFEVWLREPRLGWNNPEIKALLWDRDPYVAGFTTDQPSKFERYEDYAPRWYSSWNLAMANEYGCKSTRTFPTIPWKPKIRPEWSGKVFADVRGSSQSFPSVVIDRYVKMLGFQLEFDPGAVVVLQSRFSAPHGCDALAGNPRMTIAGLEELSSAIASCAIMLTVESGTQPFASAVKGSRATPIVCSCFTASQYNDKVFCFDNVKYFVSGFRGHDWHPYV